jgi:PAS domain S-box-containing protein
MIVGAEQVLPEDALLETGVLQNAVFNSACFCCIATDGKGAIRVLNAGAERMLGYAGAEVRGKAFAELCDSQELIARAAAMSRESDTRVAVGFEALVCKAARGGEDIYALTYLRKDGSRLPATISVSALRGAGNAITGYLLIGIDDTARRQTEEALHKLTAALAAAEFKKPVALVVEDDDRAAKLLRVFLEAEGFAVVRSISAEDALLEVPKHTLALITLDLQMYGMNGWQFLRQLRESAMAAGVPVIIASGRTAEENLAQSRGANAMLQKPIGRVELKAALAKLGLLKTPSGLAA